MVQPGPLQSQLKLSFPLLSDFNKVLSKDYASLDKTLAMVCLGFLKEQLSSGLTREGSGISKLRENAGTSLTLEADR